MIKAKQNEKVITSTSEEWRKKGLTLSRNFFTGGLDVRMNGKLLPDVEVFEIE